jgi:hypothetical protein
MPGSTPSTTPSTNSDESPNSSWETGTPKNRVAGAQSMVEPTLTTYQPVASGVAPSDVNVQTRNGSSADDDPGSNPVSV